jgi:hypothetical protein
MVERLSFIYMFIYTYMCWTWVCLLNTSRCNSLGFEVLTAVVMKSCVFWDVTPYTPLKHRSTFNVLHGITS